MDAQAPAETTGTGVRGVDRKKIGILTMAAGAGFILGPPLSQVAEPLWLFVLLGFALMLFAIPKLHAFQAPADGAAGLWGSRLVLLGVGVIVGLGITYLVWDAVGTPPEEHVVISTLWMIGFFSFVLGFVSFMIGTLRAKVFPQGAPILMLVGLVGSIALDMATGAFFQDDSGTTTEWGFIFGVPLFGLGLAWIGYSLYSETAGREAAEARPTNGAP